MSVQSSLNPLLAAIRANMKLLEQCHGPHDFSVDATPEKPLFKKWRCAKCGGVVDYQCKAWYERGIAHGKL